MRIIAVIPARFASTRLPGKPLLDICGRPMICHVVEKALQATKVDDVIVATDDERIVSVVTLHGYKALLTAKTCKSGSDRLLEVAGTVDSDIYINIQGDEPLMNPAAIDALADCMLSQTPPQVATLCYKIPDADGSRAMDPNLVKVVFDANHNALYFSRSPIPFVRDAGTPCSYFGHIGVYAYTKEALALFGSLPHSQLEEIEKLEQLRFLQAGVPIRVLETEPFGPGVDTAEDLERVRAIMRGEKTESGKKSIAERLRSIRLIVTDVDGVLTDGTLAYTESGESIKFFNAKDGLGVYLAKKKGLQIAVLSGRDSKALRRRLQDLGITTFRLGRLEKEQALQEIFDECQKSRDEALFLGDDVADIPAFRASSLGVAVSDAHPQALAAADIVLHTQGGHGALREILDMILEAKKK